LANWISVFVFKIVFENFKNKNRKSFSVVFLLKKCLANCF
jgi:hypothetical protein